MQPHTVSKLSYYQPNEPFQREHTPNYPQLSQDQGWGTAGGRTSRFQIRPEHSGTDLQQSIYHRETPTTSVRSISRLHSLMKAFDRVWASRLMPGPQKLRLVQAIQALYENSSSAILLNSQLREFSKTTVGIRQVWLLSLFLFNLFIEEIMQETLHDNHTTIS